MSRFFLQIRWRQSWKWSTVNRKLSYQHWSGTIARCCLIFLCFNWFRRHSIVNLHARQHSIYSLKRSRYKRVRRPFVREKHHVFLSPRVYAQNVRLYYPYRQYTNLTFFYFDLYLNTAYATHYVYFNIESVYMPGHASHDEIFS